MMINSTATSYTTGKRVVVFHIKDHGRTASSNLIRAMFDALKSMYRAASREMPYDTPSPEPQPAGDEPADETNIHDIASRAWTRMKPRPLAQDNPGGWGGYLLRGCQLRVA